MHAVCDKKKQSNNVVDLFEDVHVPSEAAQAKQRGLLARRAKEIEELLDSVDVRLRVDRESAISLLCEATGILEIAVEDIAIIREMDNSFGGGRRLPQVAMLAEKLEKGVAYLLGMFAVASSGNNLSAFNWKLIERDVQEVLGISRAVGDAVGVREFADAA